MNELEALSIASEYSGQSIDRMLETAKQSGFTNEAENKLRFQSLYEQGLIQGAFQFDLPVTITPRRERPPRTASKGCRQVFQGRTPKTF